MAKYKLYEIFTTPQTIREVVEIVNGRPRRRPKTLIPGAIEETNDKALLNSLDIAFFKKPYNKEVENFLIAHDVPYKVKECKGCGGGRVLKLKYKVVKILDE